MNVGHARNGKARRATAIADLHAGRLSLRTVLREGHIDLETCPVHKLLEAVPWVGKERARVVLERARIWPLLPMNKLNLAQRKRIIGELPERVQ